MPTTVLVSKRLILTFDKGSYSFARFDVSADEEAMHGLAGKLNAFQSETPKSIGYVERTQIIE